MGIHGLTSFINSHQADYLENYQLCDTNLILDGNAVTCYLYNSRFHYRNDSFGGDYDKYGQVIYDFFQQLFACKITPYVVFDGGYGDAKIPEIMRRMQNRVKCIEKLENMNRSCVTSVFPLLMWATFESIVNKLNIKMIRCTFDCDLECANIARALNCPVLSNDSDFYISDVLYIPLRNFNSDICGDSKKYIACKIYKMQSFLDFFGGLDRSKLPLLAVLLGNDHSDLIDQCYLTKLIEQEISTANQEKNYVRSTILWLQKRTTKAAIKRILDSSDETRKNRVQNAIRRAYKTYTCHNSEYLNYLGIKIDNSSVLEEHGLDICWLGNIDEVDGREVAMSNYFLENFKRGFYPSSFMDIISKNKYFCYPQVDDCAMEGAYKPSLEIVSAMHKILCKAKEPIIFMGRTLNRYIEFQEPLYTKVMPYIDEIEHMDTICKQNVIASVLNFNEVIFKDLVQCFPKSWHLFILSVKYFINKTHSSRHLISAIILCKIILDHVDKQVGFHRTKRTLYQTYPRVNKAIPCILKSDINEALMNIQFEDCLYCLESCMDFFNLTNGPRFLDKKLIHSISQFQSCFTHIRFLNSLLECPFEQPIPSDCLNCTFVFQLTKYLEKASNLHQSFESLLRNSPTIYHSLIMIITNID